MPIVQYDDRKEYLSHHSWMRRNYKKAGRCEMCGKTGKTDFAEAQPGKLSKDWADWLELCVRCHRLFDGHIKSLVEARLATVTPHCKKCGASDWYIAPRGVRQCRPCHTRLARLGRQRRAAKKEASCQSSSTT